jgi:nucleoside transporter
VVRSSAASDVYKRQVLGLYCFFGLPEVAPKAKGQPFSIRGILGLDALQLFKDSSFAVFAIGSFLICIPLAFYYSGAERFLTQIGVTEAPAKMTFGQMSEVLFMLIFPLMFARLGVKKMLVLGMACWLVRYFCFAFGNATSGLWMLLAGIVLHGPCFDFFFVTGQIYVDQRAPEHLRSAAQCLIAFITYGAGMLVGSLAQGKIISHYTLPDNTVNWSPTWIIPAIGSGVIMLAFMAFFRSPPKDAGKPEREALESAA